PLNWALYFGGKFMPHLMAVCDNCGNEFPSGFFIEGCSNVTFTGNKSGPCPNCGGMGSVNYISDEDKQDAIWAIATTKQFELFQDSITSVEALLKIQSGQKVERALLIMLHTHVVTAIESYLSSITIHKILNSEEFKRKLVESDPELSKQKFSLKEIYEKSENIGFIVAQHLKSIIFHDMKKIKPMYSKVFQYEFGDIKWLFKAISLRHDCVHRGGFTQNGDSIDVSKSSLGELVKLAKSLINNLEDHWQTKI
ncbi:hypothetical protein, partial [Vibrio parahaemolyticus]